MAHEIVYHTGFDPHHSQNDAIFYTGMGLIATVTLEGFSVDVYCDGETRANLLNEDKETVAILYTPSDFIDAGLDTDGALHIANDQEVLDWVNNSWFDIYCEGEHLDIVTHDIREAIDSAVTYLKEQRHDEKDLMKELDTEISI